MKTLWVRLEEKKNEICRNERREKEGSSVRKRQRWREPLWRERAHEGDWRRKTMRR